MDADVKKRNLSIRIYNEDEIDEMLLLTRDNFIPAFAYIIHLIWMIQEKRKPQNLKTDIVSAIFLAIILISYNVYSNQFDWKDILVKMVFIALVLIFGEITRYIYSWKE
jgi:O-antigen ligase